MTDPYDLQRFVDAQDGVIDNAMAELRAGRKQSHWMWFVFPQIIGLGRSPMAQHYAIRSLDEARTYLEHPLLGGRLRECTEAVLPWSTTQSAEEIFGSIDTVKLRSSLTLFDRVEPKSCFERALGAFFAGQRDEHTLALLDEPR